VAKKPEFKMALVKYAGANPGDTRLGVIRTLSKKYPGTDVFEQFEEAKLDGWIKVVVENSIERVYLDDEGERIFSGRKKKLYYGPKIGGMRL